MALVLDASICAAWALAEKLDPRAEKAEDQLKHDVGLAPRILWYEIRNVLVTNERRGRLSAEESTAFLRVLSAYPIRIDPFDDESSIFALARKHRLSFYDAAYLETARRNRAPLATLDTALESAAFSEGIELLV